MKNKLRSTDLMIGDWVEVPFLEDKPKVVKVEEILFDEINPVWEGMENCGGVKIRYVNPIPLTPEILEKNGFITEEREGDPTFPYLAFIIDNDEYRVEITWYDSHDVYEPNTGEYLHGAPEVWNMEILGKCSTYDCGKNKLYVHELQHALKLCGIEKTIEL